MFVRAYDKINNQYYKSIVYGILNIGYYKQAILFNPHIKAFELMDYMYKKTNMDEKEVKPLYELINSNADGWISVERVQLTSFKEYCSKNEFKCDVERFIGYPDIYHNFDFLLRILREKIIPITKTNVQVRSNDDAQEWNYIKTQNDADVFTNLFYESHNSTMSRLTYEEEYGTKELKIFFDNSDWLDTIEVCFEGLLSMNLCPPAENCSREISNVTLWVKDEMVFWAEEHMIEENIAYQGTYIKALNMKWRRIKS